MNYTITEITRQLKAERESKGLSQRALSKLAGVPQGHISKIENGTVDLRLSSLIELARVLGLEFTLVPRKTLPAIKSIVQSHKSQSARNSQVHASQELPSAESVRPAYSLDDDHD